MKRLSAILQGPDEPVNYWGFSYGTAIGGYFVNLFPDRVGHVIIDGNVNLDAWTNVFESERLKHDLVETEQVLRDFYDSCAKAGPERCALVAKGSTGNELSRAVDTLLEKLYDAPLPVVHSNRPSILTAIMVKTRISKALYGPTTLWAGLASDLLAALNGDGAPIANSVQSTAELNTPISPSMDNSISADAPYYDVDVAQQPMLDNIKSEPPLALEIPPQFTSALATHIVLSNDDGWAELNIRTFFDALLATRSHRVILSAPSQNKSGTGSSDAVPTVLNTTCQFDTCPIGSSPEGFNASDPRINYVNSFAVTAMRFGIQILSPRFFLGPPDIAVSGPNVGPNLGNITLVSGTVGAAVEAALEGIPAIAFSETTGLQIPYTSPIEDPANLYSTVYAKLSAKFTNYLIHSYFGHKPYLKEGIWLNINYPASNTSTCSEPSHFKFVLSRINTPTNSTPPDVFTCGSRRLPTERSVVATTGGCYASVSVGNASTKADVDARSQKVVFRRLRELLSCLPE